MIENKPSGEYKFKYSDLDTVADKLDSDKNQTVPEYKTVLFYRTDGPSTLRISENGPEVFHMKVSLAVAGILTVDAPKVVDGHEGRGWGMVAMYVALKYGERKGCDKAILGSAIEQTSEAYRFWSHVGITSWTKATPIKDSIGKIKKWAIDTAKAESDSVIPIRAKQ